MLKLIVVLTFVAICSTQTPPRPKIAETFVMKGEAEDHGDNRTIFGDMVIAENSATMQRVFNLTFDDEKEAVETLDLYQSEMQYIVFREGSTMKCTPSKLTTKYYPFFEWLEYAKYAGNRTVRHVVYDFWEIEIASAHFRAELGVEQTDPNTPRFFNYMLTDPKHPADIRMLIRDYAAETPPASYFTVPKECNMLNRRPMMNLRKHI